MWSYLQADQLATFVKQQKKRTSVQSVKQQWLLTDSKLSSSRSVFSLSKLARRTSALERRQTLMALSREPHFPGLQSTSGRRASVHVDKPCSI